MENPDGRRRLVGVRVQQLPLLSRRDHLLALAVPDAGDLVPEEPFLVRRKDLPQVACLGSPTATKRVPFPSTNTVFRISHCT